MKWIRSALACLTVSLAGCDAGRPLRGDLDEALLATGRMAGVTSSLIGLTSTAISKSHITLSWQDGANNETGWQIHRSTAGPAGPFTLLATAGANVTSFDDTGLTPLTQYCYRVRSFRTTGKRTTYGEFSNTSCSTTPGAPAAPSGAYARPANSSAVDVSWTDNSATEDGFRVERSATITGPWESAATTSANATSHQDPARLSEEQVCYRVVAFNAHGVSQPSNADCTTPPAGPMTLAATAVIRTVELTWADNSLIEDAYEVQRAVAEAGPYSVITNLVASSTSYRDQNLSSSTTYWYRVRAIKDGGFSDFSNTAGATTGSCANAWETSCDNGADDDCDGLVDTADPDCTDQCTRAEVDCNNFADDDCDGLVDGADPDCPAPPCDLGCPPGMTCYPDGFCYYAAESDEWSVDVDLCPDPGVGR